MSKVGVVMANVFHLGSVLPTRFAKIVLKKSTCRQHTKCENVLIVKAKAYQHAIRQLNLTLQKQDQELWLLHQAVCGYKVFRLSSLVHSQ